jgi:hypothetical protein
VCQNCSYQLYIQVMQEHLELPAPRAKRFFHSVLEQAQHRLHITDRQAMRVRELCARSIRRRFFPEMFAGEDPLVPDNGQDIEAGTPTRERAFGNEALVVVRESGVFGIVRGGTFIQGRDEWKYRAMVFEQGAAGRTMVSRGFWEGELRTPSPMETPAITMAYMEASGEKVGEETAL